MSPNKIIVLLFVICFTSTHAFPEQLDFLKNAYSWISSKIGQLYDDRSSVTIKIENVHKLGHISIDVSDALRVNAESTKNEQNNVISEKRTNLLELAKKLGLTTLIDKVIEAGVEDVLDHEGPFTLFAPTNEAFASRPEFCDNVPLKDLIKYHVGKGMSKSASFKNDLLIPTLLTRRGVRINLYKNNKVITANGRIVSTADLVASNGVLHVLDSVMCAVYKGSAALEIDRCPALSLLAKAINITDLYSVLDGSSLFTVFAPTDSAFRKLPPEVLDALLKNATALKEVLLYHVVPDIFNRAGLENKQKLKTVQGQSVSVTVTTNKVLINDATLILADATVSNGVVHSIDTVLIPKKLRSFFKTSNLSP